MTETYEGVDIAGAGSASSSGVSVIEKRSSGELTYGFPSGDWRGTNGLMALSGIVKRSRRCAVDQPFSYPRETTRLLRDDSKARGDAEISEYCSRLTDVAMRDRLRGLGVSSNYVMSPNRCQNIWRALALANSTGLSRKAVCCCQEKIVETHPRVAWSILLSLKLGKSLKETIAGFKGTGNPEAEIEYRRQMVKAFEAATLIQPAEAETRIVAAQTSDSLEALVSAYIAYLHSLGRTELCGFGTSPDIEVLELEGAAVLPTDPWPS